MIAVATSLRVPARSMIVRGLATGGDTVTRAVVDPGPDQVMLRSITGAAYRLAFPDNRGVRLTRVPAASTFAPGSTRETTRRSAVVKTKWRSS